MNINILLRALKKIIEIRIVENKIAEEFKKNKIYSFLHLSIGQEACATGVAFGTKFNDQFFGNHRSHAHYLSKNGNLEKMIMEVFGDRRGCCGGYGGSMHLLDKKVNFMGSIPILGSAVSIASGMAMANKLSNKKNVTTVFVGDGAAEEGGFYETINMAGLYKLPLLVVIEDNRYAVESNFKKRKVRNYSHENIFKKGMNCEYIRTNGQDFKKVFNSTRILRSKIIKNNKVGLLHLDCLRFSKHSGSTVTLEDQKSKYRRNEEFSEILKNDPIEILKQQIQRLGLSKKKIIHFEKMCVRNVDIKFNRILKKIKIRTL